MKKVILTLAALIQMGQAHALECTVGKQVPLAPAHDQLITGYTDKALHVGSDIQMLLMDKKGYVAPYNEQSIRTLDDWAAINGQVWFAVNQNDGYISLIVGIVNTGSANQPFPIFASANSKTMPTVDIPLTVVSEEHDIYLSCY